MDYIKHLIGKDKHDYLDTDNNIIRDYGPNLVPYRQLLENEEKGIDTITDFKDTQAYIDKKDRDIKEIEDLEKLESS